MPSSSTSLLVEERKTAVVTASSKSSSTTIHRRALAELEESSSASSPSSSLRQQQQQQQRRRRRHPCKTTTTTSSADASPSSVAILQDRIMRRNNSYIANNTTALQQQRRRIFSATYNNNNSGSSSSLHSSASASLSSSPQQMNNGYGVGLGTTYSSPCSSPQQQQQQQRASNNNSHTMLTMPPSPTLMSDGISSVDNGNHHGRKLALPEQRSISRQTNYFHHRRVAPQQQPRAGRRKKLEKSLSWNTALLRDLPTIKSSSSTSSSEDGTHDHDHDDDKSAKEVKVVKHKLRRTMSMVYTPVCNSIASSNFNTAAVTFSLPPPPSKSSMKVKVKPSRSFTNINIVLQEEEEEEEEQKKNDNVVQKPQMKMKRTDSILKRIEWSPQKQSRRATKTNDNNALTAVNTMTRNNVSFSSTSIREYPVTLGNHPSCSHGPPLSLGWEYFEDEHTLPLEKYEETRSGSRKKHCYELLLSGSDRTSLLVDVVNVDANEIEEAIEGVQRVQKQRRATDMFSEFSAIEEFFEGVGRAVKNFHKKMSCLCPPKNTS